MSTAALPQADPGEYVRASVVKVVVDARATRSTSPGPPSALPGHGTGPYRKHLGIYGYRREFLFSLRRCGPLPSRRRSA